MSQEHQVGKANPLHPFGDAIAAAKAGKRICRVGWNGAGMFVFHQVPASVDVEVIPKMTSLPQSVKDEFGRRGMAIQYSNQLALVKPDNSVNGWAPSTADALADDWLILD